MNSIKLTWGICLLLCLNTMQVKAHSPNISATVIAEQEDKTWVLQIISSMSAYQYIFKQNIGENAYASPQEFQDLVTTHLKNNIQIICDGNKKIALTKGIVSLGHELKVTFSLENMPVCFRNIQVKNESFKDLNQSKSNLIILKKGVQSEKLELNLSNDFEMELDLVNGKLVKHQKNSIVWLIFAFCCLVIVVLTTNYFYYKKKQVKQ